ncbi:fibronectin type III domain-containing protein [Nakamurella flavida]|uniref:Fibronectin type III domain-containing protein n=1 Tax=Nakamurella flavida TaxID=363630 RepID=A0A939C374_9ACTN|nr:fibronectin type III domain-containing protein [Nakamurella flavida]MBM9476791.1 fibronectin type III domain-containing protein [Nakamurella flavida]MDP9778771.1 hypothetical protein [Nakamurella flavida]
MRRVIHPVGRPVLRPGWRVLPAGRALVLALAAILAVPLGSPASASSVSAAAAQVPAAARIPAATPAAAISTTGLPAGAVRLTWSAASTSTPPVTGYVVGRTGSSTITPAPYSTTVSAGQRSWIFSSLVPGQEYRFWVAAVDAAGVGPASTVGYRYLPAGFSPVPPSAPPMPAVRWITGTSAEISWLAPDSDGGSPVTGYEVARDGAAYGNPGPYSTVVGAGTRARTFIQLIPGSTYTLSVRAVTAAGRGPAATVRYTVPAAGAAQPDAPVYALREGTPRTLERVSGPGPIGPIAGATGDVSFAVDRQGALYVADPAAATVRRFPADGGAPVAVGTGWVTPTDLNLDARGDVFVLDTGTDRAVMVRATDGRRVVFPQDATDADLAVGLDGSVVLSRQVPEDGLSLFEVSTVQALGERPATVRRVPGGQFAGSVVDLDGTVFLRSFSGLGAQAFFLTRLAAGEQQTSADVGPSRIAVGNDSAGRVLVSTIRSWCPAADPSCRIDPAVDALQVFGAGPTPRSVPVSGVVDPFRLAGDTAGRFYALQSGSNGGTAGILRIAPAGGAATVVAAGQFVDVAAG